MKCSLKHTYSYTFNITNNILINNEKNPTKGVEDLETGIEKRRLKFYV